VVERVANGIRREPMKPSIGEDKLSFRPPAVPLVTHDPYFSIWSMADNLTDEWPKHWTGAANGMCGMLRVDGKPFRFMGVYKQLAPMAQTNLVVNPLTTIYRFEAAGVRLTLTFTSPLLPDDLDLLSRSVTYVDFQVQAIDSRNHKVALHFDVSCDASVDKAEQKITWSRHQLSNLIALSAGSLDQRVLARSGDNLRIDWGYLYLAAPQNQVSASIVSGAAQMRDDFVNNRQPNPNDDLRMPRPASDQWPALAFEFDFGRVGRGRVERHLLMAYDDQFCIEYFYRKLRPYWKRKGMEFGEMLTLAEKQHVSILKKCRAFDARVMADLKKAGGGCYARLCALAYRQGVAAHKLAADFDGTPLFFSKENFSNGCIDTVDVTYPSAPFFLYFNPELLKAQIKPIMDYACSPSWRFDFAPHDLGTYPLANGQVYGGGEKTEENQMPVEESGNMLILAAAYTSASCDTEFARQYWDKLTQWAKYLEKKGLDPENQLCTDDFAGHLSHNTNLSIKAIVALGAYAQMAKVLGESRVADKYNKLARRMAKQWQKMAFDGDHYRLTFDRPGSWSQKYNLVWDRVLNLNIFPPEIARTEIAYYKRIQTKLGLPLDSRKTYTKLDWTIWSATLAEKHDDFVALTDPLFDWADTSPSRVPLSDWYETADGRHIHFQARSVVAGIFIKLLADSKRLK